jgi:hypothetical protein
VVLRNRLPTGKTRQAVSHSLKQQREKLLKEAREQPLIRDLETNSAPLRPGHPIKLDR